MADVDDMAMSDDVQTGASPFKLRSYQTEMLERSLQGNIIVAMDTGSGKTHIAIARVRAELERLNDNRVCRYLLLQINRLTVNSLCGSWRHLERLQSNSTKL